MAKQKTYTHGIFKTMRWETWGDDTKADCERNKKKEGGRVQGAGGCGGMNRSIYNECICTDFGQETRLWNWRLRWKGKAKKNYTISTRPHNRKQLQKTVKLLLLHISNCPSFSSHLLLLSHHHHDYCSDFVFQLLGAAAVPSDHYPALTFLVTIQY